MFRIKHFVGLSRRSPLCPHFDRPFIVTADALDVAVGVVLQQEDDNGRHPVSLKSSKAQNSTGPPVRKKLLNRYWPSRSGVISSRAWNSFLKLIITHFCTYKRRLPCHANRPNDLSFFNNIHFRGRHILGRGNTVADALSRLPASKLNAAVQLETRSDWLQLVHHDLQQDDVVTKAERSMQSGAAGNVWFKWDGLCYYGGRLYVPTASVRMALIKEAHDSPIASHPGTRRTQQNSG